MSNDKVSTTAIVAQGWILMCLIFVGMLAIQVMNEAVSAPGNHAEEANVKVIAALLVLHVLVPMLVYTFGARWFRWAVAGLTLLFGAMIVHQVQMFIAAPGTPGIIELLDCAHHGLAFWVGWIAVRWAREAGQGNGPVRPWIA